MELPRNAAHHKMSHDLSPPPPPSERRCHALRECTHVDDEIVAPIVLNAILERTIDGIGEQLEQAVAALGREVPHREHLRTERNGGGGRRSVVGEPDEMRQHLPQMMNQVQRNQPNLIN